MTDVIKLDKEMMLEMKNRFQKGAEELDRAIYQVQKIADEMETEGLQGMAGQAFVESMRQPMQKKLAFLRDRMEEMARDIQFNIDSFFSDADPGAGREFQDNQIR